MSRVVGSTLPPALLQRLSQRDLAAHQGAVLPLITVDGDARPHPMLLSYLEVRAYDAGTVGVVVGAGSRSARNLAARDAATMLVIEADVVMYVKLRRVDGPLEVAEDERLAYFLLGVEEVLEDGATEEEGAARIVGGLRYAPLVELDSAWARTTRAAVATPRARA